MAAGDPRDSQETEGEIVAPPGFGDLVPRPDPTALTATAVSAAKTDLRRELLAQRELLGERISRLETIIHDLDSRFSSEVGRRIEALHDLLAQRDNGIEAELQILAGQAHDARSEREALRERLQADIGIAVASLQKLHEERFAAIGQQFTERDIRADQDKRASKDALDAALLAQKEAVAQQNDANTTAATKSETSFTKQIDQIGTLIATLEKSLTDRITELKERIDRGEGTTTGAAGAHTEQRLNLSQLVAVLAIFATVAIGILLAFKKLGDPVEVPA